MKTISSYSQTEWLRLEGRGLVDGTVYFLSLLIKRTVSYVDYDRISYACIAMWRQTLFTLNVIKQSQTAVHLCFKTSHCHVRSWRGRQVKGRSTVRKLSFVSTTTMLSLYAITKEILVLVWRNYFIRYINHLIQFTYFVCSVLLSSPSPFLGRWFQNVGNFFVWIIVTDYDITRLAPF